jgi:capsular polysaccharide biosynthesis protein
MSLAGYARAVREHWPTVAVIAVLCGLLTGLVAVSSGPTYRAHIRLAAAFGPVSADPPTSTVAVAAALGDDRKLIEFRVRSYALLANSAPVVNQVIATLHLPYATGDLAPRIHVSVPLDSTFIDVWALDPDPSRAALIATVVETTLAGIATSESHSADPASTIRISVRQPARIPSRPEPVRWPLHAAGGLLAGLAAGAGVAMLRRQLSARQETLRGWSVAQVGAARRYLTAGLRAVGRRPVSRS